jgi:hypothetical protein
MSIANTKIGAVSQGHAVARFVRKQKARFERREAAIKAFVRIAPLLGRSGRVASKRSNFGMEGVHCDPT